MGRDAFLKKYGFRKLRSCFIIQGERRYDAKAIVSAAHGYDRPDLGPLPTQDFSSGNAKVTRFLESLGFDVMNIPRNPPWAKEELILALDLYLRSGVLSEGHPDVQDLSRVLRSLSIHTERPDPETFRNPSGVNLKLGNFAAIDPNYNGQGMRRGGKRDAKVWERYASDEDTLYAAASAVRKGHGLPEAHHAEPTSASVQKVAVEAQHVEQFHVSFPDHTTKASRKEQSLVLAYTDHLRSQGHCVTRHRYPLHETVHTLACDLVDETCHILYEAKGDVLRTSVRMAIGQLLDYRRFEETPKKLAILLPRQPSPDLIKLIHSVPASVVWRTDDGFECCDPSAADIRRALEFLRIYEDN